MKPLFWLDTVLSVLWGMKATRLRTGLSVLGVSFGVAAVMAVLCIGQGGEARVQMELNDIGINRAWMYPDKNATRGFKVEDAIWLTERLPGITVDAHSERYAEISTGSSKDTALIIGCQYQLPQMETTSFKSGRFFTRWEEESARPVAVLETRLAEKLLGNLPAVGQTLLVNGIKCEVIGVISKRNVRSEDGACYVPITTFNKWFSESVVDQISVSAPSQSELKSVRLKATKLLQTRTGGVEVVTLDNEAKAADNILSTFRLVILCVAAVALMVGGIGIMNMMFMSVNERIREIGIRKALGAKKNQILLHFLLEALFLALAGGLFGVLCGVLLALAASGLASVPFIIPVYAPVIGVGFSALVGMIFGLAPASRAAKMRPIDALRT